MPLLRHDTSCSGIRSLLECANTGYQDFCLLLAASSVVFAAVVMKIPFVRVQQGLTLCFSAICLQISTMVIIFPSALFRYFNDFVGVKKNNFVAYLGAHF